MVFVNPFTVQTENGKVGPKYAERSTGWIQLKIGTKGLFLSLNTNSGSKFKLADPIWRPKILKNSMSWRIWMKIGNRRLFGSLNTNSRSKFEISIWLIQYGESEFGTI